MPSFPERAEREEKLASAEGQVIVDDVTDLGVIELDFRLFASQAKRDFRFEEQPVGWFPKEHRSNADPEGRIAVVAILKSDNRRPRDHEVRQAGQQGINLSLEFLHELGDHGRTLLVADGPALDRFDLLFEPKDLLADIAQLRSQALDLARGCLRGRGPRRPVGQCLQCGAKLAHLGLELIKLDRRHGNGGRNRTL